MSDLPRIQRRIQALRAEVAELQKAADVIRRLDLLEQGPAAEAAARAGRNGRDSRAGAADAPEYLNLAGRSARDVAEYVLRQFDPSGQGMHFRQIFQYATELGWEGYNKDTIRRTVNSLREQFEALGKGRYRLAQTE
jgi:hypothetical protein